MPIWPSKIRRSSPRAAFKEALRSRGVNVAGAPASRHKFSSSTGDFDSERDLPLKLTRSEQFTVAAPLEGRKVLATHTSVPLVQDITVINKTSQNLHAELLLRLLGKVHGADGSFAQGARVVRQFLLDAGVDDNDFYLYDGSGMSMDDRIAPRAYTQLLAYAARQPWGAEWRETLPVGGVDGTLAGRFKNSPLKGRLWAKNRHARRGKLPLRLPDRGQWQNPGVFHPGERPPPRQRSRSPGHRPHRRSYCRRRVNCLPIWVPHPRRVFAFAARVGGARHRNLRSSARRPCNHRRQMRTRPLAVSFSLLTLAAALAAGCRSLPPSKPEALWTMEEARGAQVFHQKCAKCHHPTTTRPLNGPGLQASPKSRPCLRERRPPMSG